MQSKNKISKFGKVTDFLVDKKLVVFLVMMVFLAVCIVAMNFVNTGSTLISYLPENSGMRQGLDIMEREWDTDVQAGESFLLMFEGLDGGRADSVWQQLRSFDGVTRVEYDPDSRHFNAGNYTLFIVHSEHTTVAATEALMGRITDHFVAGGFVLYSYHPGVFNNPLDVMLPIAVALMVLVLLLMCESLFEPVLIFLGLGAAVVFNLGTNIVFPSLNEMTISVAAVLQLILSIVCSLILMTRYRQEKDKLRRETGLVNNNLAMKNALRNSTKTILSACIATFIGLLSLVFMSFGIGVDMGLVFSKGVLFTVVSIYTVMPALIVWMDKAIMALDKKTIGQKIAAKRAAKRGTDNGAA